MAAPTHSPDVLIVGAGIIGLSLALELRSRGACVLVVDQAEALRGASIAAAGMLAAEDPYHPAPLLPLARFSVSSYSEYITRVQELSGQAVPYQTSTTVQYLQFFGTQSMAEHSLDPRQLAPALLSAVSAADVRIREHTSIVSLDSTAHEVQARTQAGGILTAQHVVLTAGAWAPKSASSPALPVSPRKGQMLRVRMPPDSPLCEVHRAEHVYVVPRSAGPQAGTALIGATVEDAGFDGTINDTQLETLRAQAAMLGPATAFTLDAPHVEAWAGFRPSTPDGLPIIGSLSEREWIATGHYRNGILLAPGTAMVMADLLTGKDSSIDLTPFSPTRFRSSAVPASSFDIRPGMRDKHSRHL